MTLLVAFTAAGCLMTAGATSVQAQETTAAPCADTLDTAEQAYRNRNYGNAISLASQCTNPEDVSEDTAIRAHRLITLASLRQGALLQARSAVENILQIDPEYTADPVNDPPPYDLFVSMVREDVSPEVADMQPDTTEAEDEETADAPPVSRSTRSTSRGFFLKFGGGISDYTGDYPAQNVSHPLDFQEFATGSGLPVMGSVELGYQVSPRWAILLGLQVGNYPLVGYGGTKNANDSDRYTPQFLVRHTFRGPSRTVRPYIDLGGNITFGGEPIVSSGYGPSVGGGVSIVLSRTVALYVESRFNLTFPDDAIDDFASDGVNFDGSILDPVDSVNQLLGVGLRVNLGG